MKTPKLTVRYKFKKYISLNSRFVDLENTELRAILNKLLAYLWSSFMEIACPRHPSTDSLMCGGKMPQN